MTFYLKYRPKSLEELDSALVRESLIKIATSGKIPHALLFSGPKGIGKTSAARILAKILNCERPPKKGVACNRCPSCTSIAEGSNIDVLELDAASHRGIEDVRALRDAVKLSAARAPNKIYIVDEAHMLTTEASNALLKTLEEPPSHVYFILATTNPEKLVETIRSRVVSISFKKASVEELVNSLQRVARGEKLKVDKETLEVVAKASNGSFRDATKLLEQLLSEGKKLKKENIEELLFQRKELDVETILTHIQSRDSKAALTHIEAAVAKGVSVSNLLEAVLTRLREGLLAKVGVGEADLPGWEKAEIISLVKAFYLALKEMSGAPVEQLPIEVAIVDWCEAEPSGRPETILVENGSADAKGLQASPKVESASEVSEAAQKISSSISKIEEVTDEVWKRILSAVRPINTSIEALLRAAKPVQFDGQTLTLGVFYRFHKERLEEGTHRRILEDVVATVMGTPVRIACTLTAPPVKNPVEEKRQEVVLTEGGDADIIKAAKEIFGT